MKRLSKILPVRKMKGKSSPTSSPSSSQQEEGEDVESRATSTADGPVGTNRVEESLDQDGTTRPQSSSLHSDEEMIMMNPMEWSKDHMNIHRNNPNANPLDASIQPPPSIIRTNAVSAPPSASSGKELDKETVEKISTSRRFANDDYDDTSSRYYFLSEPSLSEDASSQLSSSFHGNNHIDGHANFAYMSSPGNTSISSKDCRPMERKHLIIDGNPYSEGMKVKQEYESLNTMNSAPQDATVEHSKDRPLADHNVAQAVPLHDKDRVTLKQSLSDDLSEDDEDAAVVDQLLRFGGKGEDPSLVENDATGHLFLAGISNSKDSGDNSFIRFSESDGSSVDISYDGSDGAAENDKDVRSDLKPAAKDQSSNVRESGNNSSVIISEKIMDGGELKKGHSPFTLEQYEQIDEDDDRNSLLLNTDNNTIDITPINSGEKDEDDKAEAKTPLTGMVKSNLSLDTNFSASQPSDEDTTPKRKTKSKNVEAESNKTKEDDGIIRAGENEQESHRSRRKRIPSSESGSKRSGHRRSRSGDGAAASFLPGGIDWKGMEIDKLPLPDPSCLDDDEEDDLRNSFGESLVKQSAVHRRRRRTYSSDAKLSKPKYSPSQMKQRNQRSRSLDDVVLLLPEQQQQQLQSNNETTKNAYDTKKPEQQNDSSPDKQNETGTSSSHQGDDRNEKFNSDDRKSISEVSQDGYESNFSWITNKLSVSEKDGRYPIFNEAYQNVNSHIGGDGHLPGVGAHGISAFEKGAEGERQEMFAAMKQESLSMRDPNNAALRDFQTTEEFRTTLRMNDGPSVGLLPRRPGYFEQEHNSRRKYFERINSTESFSMHTSDTKGSDSKKFSTTDPSKIDGPLHYLGKYFIIYVVASLFIFGLEEGWPALDCLYFAIMTLTTTGLGDYVPTTDSAKIICSIFIYFGIACIGLLLGSLHASSLDEESRHLTLDFLSNNYSSSSRKIENDDINASSSGVMNETSMQNDKFQVDPKSFVPPQPLQTIDESMHGVSDSLRESLHSSSRSLQLPQSQSSQNIESSPLSGTLQMTNNGFQSQHTRHLSLESRNIPYFDSSQGEFEPSNVSKLPDNTSTQHYHNGLFDESKDGRLSPCSAWSYGDTDISGTTSIYQQPVNNVKAAKYIFLTLRQAVANSVLVIFIGSIGFYYIEQWGAVNSFYFTMSLLTTVGYGDIVPHTKGGKLFASIFSLIAGTVLLTNMSMISMIPVELRKMRIEHLVLNQFGADFDDAVVKEVAGIIRRLLSLKNRPDGPQSQCSREMFSLAMLMRLGKISERDVQATFTAFRRLDKEGNGILTSRDLQVNETDQNYRDPLKTANNPDSWQPDSSAMQTTVKPSIGLRQSSAPPLYSNEHESLLHPLASHKSTISGFHGSYSSMTTTSVAAAGDETMNFYRGSRRRGMSVESTMSAITDDLEVGDYTMDFQQR